MWWALHAVQKSISIWSSWHMAHGCPMDTALAFTCATGPRPRTALAGAAPSDPGHHAPLHRRRRPTSSRSEDAARKLVQLEVGWEGTRHVLVRRVHARRHVRCDCEIHAQTWDGNRKSEHTMRCAMIRATTLLFDGRLELTQDHHYDRTCESSLVTASARRPALRHWTCTNMRG